MSNLERNKILDEVKKIVLNSLENTNSKVYLFGSWAREQEKRTSDIDIAIEYIQPSVQQRINEIRFILEESTVPYKVDIIDLNNADQFIVDKAKLEGIVWKDYVKE